MPYTHLWLLLPAAYGGWVFSSLSAHYSFLLCERGKYLDALKHSRSAAALLEKRYGAKSLPLATELLVQSQILNICGVGEDAVFIAESADHMIETMGLKEHQLIEARTMVNFTLANCYSAADRSDDALKISREMLFDFEALDPRPRSEIYAATLCNTGYYSLMAGHNEAALKYLRQALDVMPQNTTKLTKVTIQNNLGEALRRAGLLDEAEKHLMASLAQRDKLLPRGHPHRAYAYHYVANFFKDKGMQSQAETYFLKALEIRTLYPGIHQRELKDTVANYSDLLKSIGREPEAHALLEVHHAAEP